MNQLILSCFAILWLPFLSNAQQTFSLDGAVNYAMQHNTAIKNAQIGIADAEGQIVENRAIGLPQLSVGVDYQYNLQLPTSLVPAKFFDPTAPDGQFAELQFGTKHNLGLAANFSWLALDGSYLVSLRGLQVYRDLTQQQFQATQQKVKNSVREAYLPSLIIAENITILDKNIANLNKLLSDTKALYKEGFAEQLDVDRLDLSLANLKVEKDNLQRQKEKAITYLKFAIGFPIGEDLSLSDDIQSILVEATQDDLAATIDYNARLEYAATTTNIELNEINVKRLRFGYLPNLMLNASYQRSMQGDNSDNSVWFPAAFLGAKINVPIFDGMMKKGRIQQAQLDLELSKIQQTELERSIQLEVQNARTDYYNAKERLTNQEKTLDLAQKIYNTTQIKYKEGIGSSLELTQAEQSLYDAQRHQTQALYDLLLAKTALDNALGK